MRRSVVREALRAASAAQQLRTHAAAAGAASRAADQIAQLAQAGVQRAFTGRLHDAAALSARAPILGARLHSSEAEPAQERAAEAGPAPADLLSQIVQLSKDDKYEDATDAYKQWRASPEGATKSPGVEVFSALLIAEGKRRGDAFSKMRRLHDLMRDIRATGEQPEARAFEPLCLAAIEMRSYDLAHNVLESVRLVKANEAGALFAALFTAVNIEPSKPTAAYNLLMHAKERGLIPPRSSGSSAVRVRARIGVAKLLNTLCKRQLPAEAVECARVLRDIGFPSGQASLGEILACAADGGDVGAIAFAVASLRDYQPSPGEKPAAVDQGTAVACINAAAASSDPAAAQVVEDTWALLRQSLETRAAGPPSPLAFDALVAARAAKGDAKGAFEAISEWAQIHPLTGAAPGGWGSIRSVRPIVRAIVAKRDLDGAYYLLVQQQERGLPVPAAAVAAVVAACSRLGDVQRAFATFEELGRTFPARPDTAAFNALLEGCISQGRADAVPSLAAEMEVQGVPGDLDTLSFLIDAARMRGDVAGAIALAKSRAYSEAEPPPRAALVRLHQYASRDPTLREKVEAVTTELGLTLAKAGDGTNSLTH